MLQSIKISLTTLLVIPFFTFINAQGYGEPTNKTDDQRINWPNGAKMAISLSFDDARLSQIDKGIPLLDSYQVKGTFYVSPDRLKERLEGWKQAVASGHDIGNHTIVHPCSGNYPWARHKALENYSLDKMYRELDLRRFHLPIPVDIPMLAGDCRHIAMFRLYPPCLQQQGPGWIIPQLTHCFVISHSYPG